MKVKVLSNFKDLKENKIRFKYDIFEVDKKRFTEINSTPHGKLVEEIKEVTNKDE